MGSKAGSGKGGGKGGSDGGGGNGSDPLTLMGTDGYDRLRAGSGDDTLEGLGGDDLLLGGDGIDTAVYAGSVWEYSWRTSQKGYTVDDRNAADGDTGTDELQGIEILKFDDATIILGEDSPTVIEGPDTVYLSVGEEITFDLVFWDYDHFLDVDNIGADTPYLPYRGSMSFYGPTDYGGMGSTTTLHITYDASDTWTIRDLAYLAEGETITVTYTFEVTSYGIFAPTDGTDIYYDVAFVIAGINEAPIIEGTASLGVVENGADAVIDLSQFGDDVDSDDDGSTLTYRIVSVSPGFDISIDGTTLTFAATSVDPKMTADESVTGEVVIQAIDRHGAESGGTITLDLTATGQDGPPTPVYVTPSGIDYAALGVDLASAPHYGFITAWPVYESDLFDAETADALLGYTDGDDVNVIRTSNISWFNYAHNIEDVNRVELYDDATFRTGGGDDVLVFDVAYEGNAIWTSSDVDMGDGEDVLAIQVRSPQAGAINGARINTGMNGDQVFLSVDAIDGWINASVKTGSGHDTVVVHHTDPDTSDLGGHGLIDASFNLGSGNDSLTVISELGARALTAEMDLSISAGTGDDTVYLSNSGTSLEQVEGYTGGSAGLRGSVDLGDGDDLLELDLNDAGVYSEASLEGGEGYDVLILHHMAPGDAIVDAHGEGWRIVDGGQFLFISGFEEIRFSDGSDLLV